MVDQKCATPKFLKWFIPLVPAGGGESLEHMALKLSEGTPLGWIRLMEIRDEFRRIFEF